MRPMYDALLAAASPVDAPADLYEVRLTDTATNGTGPLGARQSALGGATRALQRAVIPVENVIRVPQPRDRGTLPEVLLAILELLPRDPEAVVVVTAADQSPLAILDGLARVVERPDDIVLLRPEAASMREGLGFVAEAKTILRLLLDAAPVWAGLLCESVLDPAAVARAYQMLPPAAIEPILRARVADQAPHLAEIEARRTNRPIGLA